MNTLIVKLAAVLVNYPATPRLSTYIELTIVNSKGIISIENKKETPRSIHEFTFKLGKDDKLNELLCLSKDEIALIFATACSLANEGVLFTPIQLGGYLDTSIELDKEPAEAEITDTPNGKRITVKITTFNKLKLEKLLMTTLNLDESQILDTLGKLLSYGKFNTPNRNRFELNVIQAINNYQDAFKTVSGSSRYNALYIAFEKAVNADGDREGPDFDKRASEITELPENVMGDLRHFADRGKHIQRNEKDIEMLKNLEKQFHSLIALLKIATDRAILYRIQS